MPKIYSRLFHRTHLRLYRDDWDWIVSASAGTELSATEMARNIIAAAVKHLRARADRIADEQLQSLEPLENLMSDTELNLNDEQEHQSRSLNECP